MTRIDFYILSSSEIQARFAFACKLATKAVGLGHNVYIHCDNEADAVAVKHLLDSSNTRRFLPNAIIEAKSETSTAANKPPPIQIAYGDCKSHHHDILINASSFKPNFFATFDRLSEVVIQADTILKATRDSYRFYQSRNYPLHRHDLRSV